MKLSVTVALASMWALSATGEGLAQEAAPAAFAAARVAAADANGVAVFYKAAFGLQEVRRIERPGLVEIILGFGATPEAARASKQPRLVILGRPAGAAADVVPHIIFTVPVMQAAVSRVIAAGGTVARPPKPNVNGIVTVTMVADPAGNIIELLVAR